MEQCAQLLKLFTQGSLAVNSRLLKPFFITIKMNKLTKVIGALALILGAMPSPVLADYYRKGGSETTTCVKKVYREEYIPGTSRSNPGRVRGYYERKRVPCDAPSAPERARQGQSLAPTSGTPDDNSCVEGSILGGIAGGAAGGTLATKKNWIWSIPAGVIGGALIGCQVDGG